MNVRATFDHQERGFLYVNTPIITASDCEGAGEQFLVTTQIQADGKLPASASATTADPAVVDSLNSKVAQQAAAVKSLKSEAEVNKANVKAAVEVRGSPSITTAKDTRPQTQPVLLFRAQALRAD